MSDLPVQHYPPTQTFAADGLGPPCAGCGQRITGTTRTVEPQRIQDWLTRVAPYVSPWRNESCGCEVEISRP